VELFEARRQLGGRAGSFFDAESGEWIDHCQHVALGCCTEYLEFCRAAGILSDFQADDTLHFVSRTGHTTRFRGVHWLPAPLHLAPALLRLKFLPWRDRLRVARTLRKLQRQEPVDSSTGPSIATWLREQGESETALARFWSIVLVSALSETLDRISVPAARQVFVEGFMESRTAYHLWRPRVSLKQLYDTIASRLIADGAQIHLESPVRRLVVAETTVTALELSNGTTVSFDHYVPAVPWRRIAELFDDATRQTHLPQLATVAEFSSAPIAAVHLWFDRPITNLPHAVLLDRLSQWLFAKPGATADAAAGHYYQVVISAAQELTSRSREDILGEVLADLREAFPAAGSAQLLRGKVLIETHAVFSPLPGITAQRPGPETALTNLTLAGDWTASGWPSTMEGAVRSGNRAATHVQKTLRLVGCEIRS